jgi:hypothetical protein
MRFCRCSTINLQKSIYRQSPSCEWIIADIGIAMWPFGCKLNELAQEDGYDGARWYDPSSGAYIRIVGSLFRNSPATLRSACWR